MTAVPCHYTLKCVVFLAWAFLEKIQMFGKTLFKNPSKDEVFN